MYLKSFFCSIPPCSHKKEHLCINKWIVRSVDTNGPCVKNASGSTMAYIYVQMIDVNSIFN